MQFEGSNDPRKSLDSLEYLNCTIKASLLAWWVGILLSSIEVHPAYVQSLVQRKTLITFVRLYMLYILAK